MTQSLPQQIRMGNAKKELGFGFPPHFYSQDTAEALAQILADPASRGIIAESAQWNFDFPAADADVFKTLGKVLAPFGTPNGQPPPGVVSSSNTLGAPQMPNNDMVILGVRTRFLVEPQSRLIRGNAFDPTGLTATPGSPDVFSEADWLNNVLGVTNAVGEGGNTATPDSVGYLPAELLWGLPTWIVAYNLTKAMDLVMMLDNQDAIVREPLTEVGSVQPFAQAMAAGTSFSSNIDRIAYFNNRMTQVGLATPVYFEPITHKRLGSFTSGGNNLGDFTPTREEDGSPTAFGGIGVPNDASQDCPYIFPVPIFWPSGKPFNLSLSLNDAGSLFLAQAQRWLSVTGGSNGNAGQDLNLPPGVLGGFTNTGAGIMDEVTLDGTTPPTVAPQGVQLNRLLGKGGQLVLQQGIIGLKVPQTWKKAVMDAINKGAIQAPAGYGTLVGA